MGSQIIYEEVMKRIDPQMFDGIIPNNFIQNNYLTAVRLKWIFNQDSGITESDNIIYHLVTNKLMWNEAHISQTYL